MTSPLDRLGSLLDDLPARIAAAREQATEFAGRSFAGQSADHSVSATVDGSGRLLAVDLSAALRQRVSNVTVGERIAEAVNRALDDADAAREALLAEAVPAEEPTGAEELFTYRMDELQRTLDTVEARLQDAIERATRPVDPPG